MSNILFISFTEGGFEKVKRRGKEDLRRRRCRYGGANVGKITPKVSLLRDLFVLFFITGIVDFTQGGLWLRNFL